MRLSDLRSLPIRLVIGVLGAAGCAYVGLAVADVAPRPWQRSQQPVEVRVETDPRQFLADLPYRWAEFEYVFMRRPEELGRPPYLCHHRSTWARRHGGVDAEQTTFRIYIEGRTDDRTVILGAPRIMFREPRQPPLQGTRVACPVGGAQPAIRKLTIDLDKAAGCFTSRDGVCAKRAPQFTLAKGDVEIFDVTAATRHCFCEWSIEIPYSVGREKHSVEITDEDGKPFKTTGLSRAKTYSFAGNRWYRGVHLAPPR
jgi:hypothetical protein